jgi:phosphate acetyltransferase
MTRAVLHIAPVRPDISVEETARRLLTELENRAVHVNLGPLFAADPVPAATDPDRVLSAAVEAVEKVSGDVVVTSAQLPEALHPVAFTLQARLATELGAGLVLVSDGIDSSLEQVATAAATDLHATVVGVRLVDGSWTGNSGGASSYRLLSGSFSNHVTDPTHITISPKESAGDVLKRLTRDTCPVVPAERIDILIGLIVGLASGRFPLPATVLVSGEGLPKSVTRTWNRFVPTVALVQLGASSSGAAVLDRARQVRETRPVTPLLFQRRLLDEARAVDQRIVLPEGTEPRIVRAAADVLRTGGARLILLGDPETVRQVAASEGVDISGADIVDPTNDPLRERFADEYAELRATKGITREQAHDRVADVSYFGTMMVRDGLADGMVSGAVNTTAHTIRPAFEVIRTKPGVSLVSSVFFMCLPDRVLAFGDCAVNPNPTAPQLADIAIASAVTAEQFGLDPRVALLSYSTGTSGTGPDVDLVKEATAILHEKAPGLCADGPLQFDAAVAESVARSKAPGSPVAGRANVLIFPDLSAGNAGYKAVQRTAGALAIGPVLQGLNRPVNDLSRGALVEDIVNTILITAIQAGRETR